MRLGRAEILEIEDLRGWLTTVVGRHALDALGSARRRRESDVGEWLPEPVVEEAGADPTLDEAVSTALLVVLERLSPAERTAFLLHDVFELPFDQVAAAVGRSPAAVCRLASRARARVEAGQPRFPATADDEERIAGAFALAWQDGDLKQLLELLDPASAKAGRGARGRLARVNGATGIVAEDGETTSVVSLTIDSGRIVAVDIVRNPEKLRRLAP